MKHIKKYDNNSHMTIFDYIHDLDINGVKKALSLTEVQTNFNAQKSRFGL